METSTCPRRIMADNGRTYVVKIRGDVPKSFFNEYVAANIARWAELSVAEPAVIHLDAKFIGRTPGMRAAQVRPGPYFATQHYANAYDMHAKATFRPPAITNLEEVPAFVAFGVFVHNKDRNDGNTLLVPPSGGRAGCRYLLIDHGHCFGGPKWDHGTAASLPYEASHMPWPTAAAAEGASFRGPVEKMARMDRADMDKARDGLPGEWSMPDGDYAALKSAMSSSDPARMLGAIRSGRGRPGRAAGGLDRRCP